MRVMTPEFNAVRKRNSRSRVLYIYNGYWRDPLQMLRPWTTTSCQELCTSMSDSSGGCGSLRGFDGGSPEGHDDEAGSGASPGAGGCNGVDVEECPFLASITEALYRSADGKYISELLKPITLALVDTTSPSGSRKHVQDELKYLQQGKDDLDEAVEVKTKAEKDYQNVDYQSGAKRAKNARDQSSSTGSFRPSPSRRG